MKQAIFFLYLFSVILLQREAVADGVSPAEAKQLRDEVCLHIFFQKRLDDPNDFSQLNFFGVESFFISFFIWIAYRKYKVLELLGIQFNYIYMNQTGPEAHCWKSHLSFYGGPIKWTAQIHQQFYYANMIKSCHFSYQYL